MRALVTGATGFLGRHLVRALLDRKHMVRAVVRPMTEPDLPDEVDVVTLDLRAPIGLVNALDGVDVVVHAASAKSGDFHTQFGATVTATENLVTAMTEAAVKRIVLVSSFSVYDYARIPAASIVTESSPVVRAPMARDAYSATKRLQEEVVERAVWAGTLSATIVRPGAIYGVDNLWTARLGYQRDMDWWVCVGNRAKLPLTYVRNCADAIAHVAHHHEPVDLRRVNMLDDEQPTQRQYRDELVGRLSRPRHLIVLPWPMVNAVVVALNAVNVALGSPLQLPGPLRSEDAVARWRPISYSNQTLHDLGWRQPVRLSDALDECTSVL